MALRKTVQRSDIVEIANRMISHLSTQGTKSAKDKREAIISAVATILNETGAYAGYRYLETPISLPPDSDGWVKKVYDESRVNFY